MGPELNVQNGVLKALSFLFEYIGEMGKDYIYAVTPLFEDALQERDLVHRQIATAAISHMTIGVAGFGCEDALNHLLNYIWPNIFENSPHVCQAVHACLEGMRVSLGPIRILQYSFKVYFIQREEYENAIGAFIIIYILVHRMQWSLRYHVFLTTKRTSTSDMNLSTIYECFDLPLSSL